MKVLFTLCSASTSPVATHSVPRVAPNHNFMINRTERMQLTQQINKRINYRMSERTLLVIVYPSSADVLQGVEALARSLTPDKLSALRSGAGLGGLSRTSLEPSGALRRPSLEPSGGLRRPSGHIGHSPFASLNSSPIRRLSIHRRSSR